VLLLAAAALVTPPTASRASASVQATATIRIVKGATLRLDGSLNPGVPPARVSVTKFADGSIHQLKVIEFQ